MLAVGPPGVACFARRLEAQDGRSGIQGGQQVHCLLKDSAGPAPIMGNSDSTLVSRCHQPTESAQPPGKEDGAVFAGDLKR